MAGRVVWKYELPIGDDISVEMPERAQVLTVAEQHGKPCMWALVDPGAKRIVRRFHVRGTGHTHSEYEWGRYLGSFQLIGGSFVGHVFEPGQDVVESSAHEERWQLDS